jgi:NDP-sugar pyrophosphorylase family protein
MVGIGVILAAGAGVRAYPATHFIPKVMLEIGGKPLILRNLEILRDQLGIINIYIVIGHLGEKIRSFLGDGSDYGVHLSYVTCANPSIGLAHGLLLVKDYIQEPFVAILGDEMYIESNHYNLINLIKQWSGFSAACGVLRTNNPQSIKKNYAVAIENGKIAALVEKPDVIYNNLLGCGTYVFTTEIFDAIEHTQPSSVSGRVELTEVIDTLVKGGGAVYPLFLKGQYVNINSLDDYNYANYIYKAKDFYYSYKISVVIPAYNEEISIASVVDDFIDVVDEVFVVDNSSTDNTVAIARAHGARVETVKLRGYGDTIKYGLDHANGDILILTEADYSFRAGDLNKILEYLKDSDMVIGTRTTRQLIEQGANMNGLLRWGNVFVGKLIELLWWAQEPRFTDVGCSYRGLWKDTYAKIRDYLTSTGPEFAPEMMIEVLRARKLVVEIPVSYYPRMGGESKHSQSYWKICRTALRMLKLIFKKKFNL